MPINTPVILGGAALLAFLLNKSSSKSSTSTGGNSGGQNGGGADSSGQGDLGQPAGPNGCKPGLILKDGICSDPNTPKENDGGNGNGGGGGGNTLKPTDLYITKDCKTVKFGDKTGDSWWKVKGKPTAQKWINNGYLNPLSIAFQMLKNETCPATFPMQDNFSNRSKLENARITWIKKNKPAWALIFWLRNKIDDEFFQGITSLKFDPKTNNFLKGKNFDWDKTWTEFLGPMAAEALKISQENGGIKKLIPSSAMDPWLIENPEDYEWATLEWMTYFITPSLSDSDFKSRWVKNLAIKMPAIVAQIQDEIDNMTYDDFDIDFEGMLEGD